MTSPVDTRVKFFSSLMTGAPVLNGVAGAGIALLDACLKDGFGLVPLTSLVASGGVMTATFSAAHGSQIDSVVLIAGVTGGPSGFAGANGEQKVVARPTTNTATWATTLPDGAYTGSITMRMAPLGWTKPFSGTNLAAYRMSDPAGTGMFMRVDDTATLSMRVQGAEYMGDINTVLGGFPTTSPGSYWHKSSSTNTTAIPWMLIGDSRGFFLHTQVAVGSTASWTSGLLRYFGDFTSLRPGGDGYACGNSNSGTSSSGSDITGQPDLDGSLAVPRAATGLGGSVNNAVVPYTGQNLMSGADTWLGPFPGTVDGKLRLSTRFVANGAIGSSPRGELPGLYHAPHSTLYSSFRFNDRVEGTDLLAGRRLIVVNDSYNAPTQAPQVAVTGATFFDITGPWAR